MILNISVKQLSDTKSSALAVYPWCIRCFFVVP